MCISADTQFGKPSQLASDLETYVQGAANDGHSLHEVEQRYYAAMLQMGHQAMKTFLELQPDGYRGETITTEEG